MQKESRIYKFILRTSTAAKELDLAAMECLGVGVRRVEYASEGEGRLLALVQLVDKMRKSDIVKKLFGGLDRDFPYNRMCSDTQKKISETDAVTMLVLSGETKVEYQQVFAMHFVGSSTVVVDNTNEMDSKKKKQKRMEPLSENEQAGAPTTADPLMSHLNRWGVQFLEQTRLLHDADVLALRDENTRLRKELSGDEGLHARVKDLEVANAGLLAKKDAFDRLTVQYAAWRYDTRCKDERIAELEARNAELQKDLARMTECRDSLAGRALKKGR